jgi:hypothetical protein
MTHRHARELCTNKHVKPVAMVCIVSALGYVILTYPSARGLLLPPHNHYMLKVCKEVILVYKSKFYSYSIL